MSIIGVDFGGTRIKAGIVDGADVARSEAIDTPASAGPRAVLDAIAALVRAVDVAPTSVGIAIPGECDAEGRCYRLPNVPGFEGFPIAAELRARLGCPVTLENDATTAALGEMVAGHGRAHESFVMVTLGTGIGGGLVIDGRLRRGRHGFAGELGHVPIDRRSDAPLCGCGLRGCVEAFAGTKALLARAHALSLDVHDIRGIAALAESGHEDAQLVFDEMGTALGFMLTSLQNALDVDAIVFSGGISASFRALIEPAVRRTLRARAYAPPLGEVPLLVSELGDRAGIVGAANLPRIAAG